MNLRNALTAFAMLAAFVGKHPSCVGARAADAVPGSTTQCADAHADRHRQSTRRRPVS